MNYQKISLGGKKVGPGTFDTFFTRKYANMQEALAANDYAVIDTLKGEDGLLYFQGYHSKDPDTKTEPRRLNWQDPRFGVDVLDDGIACEMADELIKKHESLPHTD